MLLFPGFTDLAPLVLLYVLKREFVMKGSSVFLTRRSLVFLTVAVTVGLGLVGIRTTAAQARQESAAGDGAYNQAAARAAQNKRAVGDYVANPQMQTLHHWDHMPIRIYFAPDAASTKARIHEALTGISEWSVASEGVLWYTVVSKAADADVTIRFVEDKTVSSDDPSRVGETETETQGDRLVKARIRLAVADTTPQQIAEDAAHEYGHALGIAGHSDDPRDLMYPSTPRYYLNGVLQSRRERMVTLRDLNTIRRAYRELFAAATGH